MDASSIYLDKLITSLFIFYDLLYSFELASK